jgi:penicillin-binding protein 1A
MTSGTGVGADFGKTSAGKTGTTDNYADAWFCGYTPNLEATVWIGYPKGEIPMLSVHGITVSGPTFPTQIWRLFMENAVGSTEATDFPTPHSYPVWKSFKHGQYALQYAPATSSSGDTYVAPETTTAAPSATRRRPCSTAASGSR